MREHKTSAEHACINTRARLIADLGDETARAEQRAASATSFDLRAITTSSSRSSLSLTNTPPRRPLFGPVDTEEWGRWFAASLGRDLSEVYRSEDDATWTTLLRADGSPNLMPLDRFPYGSDIRSGWV
jgi:hypothetical protein